MKIRQSIRVTIPHVTLAVIEGEAEVEEEKGFNAKPRTMNMTRRVTA
jgi:hypothetical protein